MTTMFAVVNYVMDRNENSKYFEIKNITSDLELAKKIAFNYNKEQLLKSSNYEDNNQTIFKISDKLEYRDDHDTDVRHKSYGDYYEVQIDSDKQMSNCSNIFSVIELPSIDNNVVVDDIDTNLLVTKNDYEYN